MFKNKLLSASKTFVNKTNEHCLVLTFDDSRTGLEGAGDDVWVKAMGDNMYRIFSSSTKRQIGSFEFWVVMLRFNR